MKNVLKIILLLALTMSSGLHAFGMPVLDHMVSSNGMQAADKSSQPNNCVSACLAKTHDFSAIVSTSYVSDLLLFLLVIVAFALLFLAARYVISVYRWSSYARPPDIITLYAHYLI